MSHPENRALALAFMLAASALIAGTTVLAKSLGTDALGPPLHPFQISHGRFVFAWLAITAVLLALRARITGPNLKLHALRSTFGWGGVTLMFAAVSFIPLADATAISFLNPVFAMMLAIPMLGERVGPIRWLAAAIALIGAVILLNPGQGSFEPAALLALGAAIILGVEITLIKFLTGKEPAMQILFLNNSFGVIIASLAVLFVWHPPTLAQWAALGALGLMMASAQACFVQSMSRAESSFVVPFSYATLVFAAVYDFAIFDVQPGLQSLFGAGVIIAGAALLAYREGRQRRKSLVTGAPRA